MAVRIPFVYWFLGSCVPLYVYAIYENYKLLGTPSTNNDDIFCMRKTIQEVCLLKGTADMKVHFFVIRSLLNCILVYWFMTKSTRAKLLISLLFFYYLIPVDFILTNVKWSEPPSNAFTIVYVLLQLSCYPREWNPSTIFTTELGGDMDLFGVVYGLFELFVFVARLFYSPLLPLLFLIITKWTHSLVEKDETISTIIQKECRVWIKHLKG